MYPHLLATHSLLRWLVLATLLVALFRAALGYWGGRQFSKADTAAVEWTVRLFQIQFIVGLILYFVSPVTQHFWANLAQPLAFFDGFFFGVIHMALMVAAVGSVSVGHGKAQRETDHRLKFRLVLVWFAAALVLLVVAVPWPGSPLAERALWRGF